MIEKDEKNLMMLGLKEGNKIDRSQNLSFIVRYFLHFLLLILTLQTVFPSAIFISTKGSLDTLWYGIVLFVLFVIHLIVHDYFIQIFFCFRYYLFSKKFLHLAQKEVSTSSSIVCSNPSLSSIYAFSTLLSHPFHLISALAPSQVIYL